MIYFPTLRLQTQVLLDMVVLGQRVAKRNNLLLSLELFEHSGHGTSSYLGYATSYVVLQASEKHQRVFASLLALPVHTAQAARDRDLELASACREIRQ